MGRASLGTRSGHLCEEAGFTLVELNVALVVVLVAGGLLLSVYLLAYRWFEDRRLSIEVENDLHLVAERLATDLVYADQLAIEDSVWTLTYAAGYRHVYRFAGEALMRDGVRMHGPGVVIDTFALTPSREALSYALRRDVLAAGEAVDVQVQVRLVLSGRRHTRDHTRAHTRAATTTVALRQERPWELLPLVIPDPE